jgi:hypothetical protein
LRASRLSRSVSTIFRCVNKATADIAQFNHAHLVRLYEAACGVEFPEAEVTTFRHTCQDAIGRTLKLSDHRQPKPAQS